MNQQDFLAAQAAMQAKYGKDVPMSFATIAADGPSVRIVDFVYEDGALYCVTHGLCNKVKELQQTPAVALCNFLDRFTGTAENIGHPLAPENAALRELLTRVFAPWYFAHNNEQDENMCYVKITLKSGFLAHDNKGYNVDFIAKTAEEFPFSTDIQEL